MSVYHAWCVSTLCLGLGALALPARAEAVVPCFEPFPLEAVRLAPGPLFDAMERNGRYLLSIDTDRLLYAFRVNAQLPAPGEPLGGWENPSSEVRGHFVGHYLSACAMMYASTGDERFKRRGSEMVEGLAECQKSLGDGYLSAYPRSFFDRLEAGQPVWAVYYTVHKMMAGLLDLHRLCGNEQALEVLKGMAACFKSRCDRFSSAEDLRAQLDKNEEGGICEVLWNLYAVTGDPDHRALAEKLEKRTFLGPLALGQDNLAGRHGNTHIPLAIGAVRRYELTGEERYLYAAQTFWDRVVTARSFATGGVTDHEVFGEPYKLAQGLNDTNHETCKTHNLLKLTRHLLCITGDTRYGDYYERAFLNGILGTIGPEIGQYEYYVPQQTGFRRVFGTPFDAFWCCYGTGVESYAKLADSIYFHDDHRLMVNLFLPSSVEWKARGVTVEQSGDPTAGEAVRFVVSVIQPVAFTLQIRRPAWLAGSPAMRLNGQDVDASMAPYFTLDRVWRDGDLVELHLPVGLHTMPLPDDPTLQAVLYGPVVLAGIVEESNGAVLQSNHHLPPQPEADRIPRIYFTSPAWGDTSWLKLESRKPLTFRAEGQTWPLVFKPFHDIVSERYGLCWPILPAGSDRRVRYDEENAALALYDRILKNDSLLQLDDLEKECVRVLSKPGAESQRPRVQLALASAFRNAGQEAKAHALLQPYVTPFITQSRADAVWAVLGTPNPGLTNVQPIIVDASGGDGACVMTRRDQRPAVSSDLLHGKRYLYFILPPNSMLVGLDATVTMTVDYYADGAAGSIVVEYDGADAGGGAMSAYTAAAPVPLAAEAGWRLAEVICPRAMFLGRQNHGAAFRISRDTGGDLLVGDVRLSADVNASTLFDAFTSSARDAVDHVVPGDEASEKAHAVACDNSGTGVHLGRSYRHGLGWFSYVMQVASGSHQLSCVYWGPDTGRVFNIAIDGKVIATQRLDRLGGPGFVEVTYEIPLALTTGKNQVTVTFTGRDGTLAGGLFLCSIKPQ